MRRCAWGASTPDYIAVSRRRMGTAGRRRHAPVREAVPRRLPGGAVMAHDPAQARGVPRARSKDFDAAKVARYGARDVHPAARRRRDRASPGQDRSDDRERARDRGRAVSITDPWPRCAGPSSPGRAPASRGRSPTSRPGPTMRFEGAAAARVPLRRPDDRVHDDASRGTGQRPSLGLCGTCAVRGRARQLSRPGPFR